LLAATIASLATTFAAGYVTRSSLIAAGEWIAHTNEVKLAINECQLALGRNDLAGLRTARGRVEHLTLDNPRQQQQIARANLLAEEDNLAPLSELFAAMHREEDRLMEERVQWIASARSRSSAVFIVGAALTLVFGIAAFGTLRAQKQALARKETLLQAIIESVDEGIIAVGPSREMLAINAAARSYWGTSVPKDRWPSDWRPTLHATYENGSVMAPEQGPLARAMRGESSDNVVYHVMPSGENEDGVGRWVSASARPIRDDLGAIIAAVTTLRDITEQRADAERLRDQSMTDELTGLLNRRGFVSLATLRLDSARKSKLPLALLYADVNGLKTINDQLGHEQGDRAIQDAAAVLRSVLRDADIVARIGGDEFVGLLVNFAPGMREPLLERLTKAIRAHVEREPRPYRLSISTGMTLVDWDSAPSLGDLLADADRQMYERKRERERARASLPPVAAGPSSVRLRRS
jgi:diguanylate cyclase (GGDEF)-like protein